MTVECLLYWIRDRLWPTLEPVAKREKSPEISGQIDRASAVIVMPTLEKYSTEEQERLRAVEAKLAGILGFVSISGTLVLGLVTFVTKETAGSYVFESLVTLVAGAAYIILQLLRAGLASIAGLRRRPYGTLTLSELVKVRSEDENDYFKRLVDRKVQAIAANIEQTNEKVSQMEIAHVALRNALFALVIMTVMLGGIAIYNHH